MSKKKTNPPSSAKLAGPQYWRSLDEVADTPEFKEWLHREFPAGASESEGINRRHFLKIMAASFGLAGLGLAGCRQPRHHILPYADQPERVIPGVPLFYASSMPGSCAHIPLIVETHEARPTKIEGNPSYPAYNGATDIYAQASVLDLYDPDRSRYSTGNNKQMLNPADVLDILESIRNTYTTLSGEGLAFLADKSASPTRARLVQQLKAQYPKARWVEYEPITQDQPETAFKKATGKRLRPFYNFEKAKRILALESDFLENGPGHLSHARGFAQSRRVEKPGDTSQMNRLYAVESDFTLTGGMADHRLRLANSHMGAFTAALAAEVFAQTGGSSKLINTLRQKSNGLNIDQKWLKTCVQDLVSHKGQSLIIAGTDLPEEIQLLVASLNAQLSANGTLVTYAEIPEAYTSDSIDSLAQAIQTNQVNTLVILNGNPAYNAPAGLDWKALQSKVPQVVHFSFSENETTELSHTHIAAHHYLESWGDGRACDGTLVPVQPMIMPLFETFSELEVIARIMGNPNTESYDLVRETFGMMAPGGNFEKWLAEGVQNGTRYTMVDAGVGAKNVLSMINGADFSATTLSATNLEFRFKPSHHTWDGRYNNNGWMMECPDPMSKLTWDNAIHISPRLAKELEAQTGKLFFPNSSVLNKTKQLNKTAAQFVAGKENAWIAEITVDGRRTFGPVHVQPGLSDYTVILPLGFGRKKVGRIGVGTGFDVYPLIENETQAHALGGSIRITEDKTLLANTQEHWSMEGRAIIREANSEDFEKHPDFVAKMGMESHTPNNYGSAKNMPLAQKATEIPRGESAYKTPAFKGEQQWGMTVDLNTCTGCNSCVVACQSENNIAIVGKDQVLRGREMHWIRLDRYYSSAQDSREEIPEDPQVSFMNVMCQHCELAPCEMVCPVNATVHDEEGLNTMAYNRCVGTRYCANNCPWKVRRFNFFDWNKREIGHFYEGPLGPAGMAETHQMQKNPDVTVRMRGVMEKCTFCVQRIEEAKIRQRSRAKDSNNVKVADGIIKVACQQACPTDSIAFGDIADPSTEVSRRKNLDLDYSLLGYLNTRPRVTYTGKVRNPNPAMPDYKKQPLSRVEYEKRYGHEAHASAHHAVTH